MLERRTTGSVVCPTCGRLVGVLDERCYECGRWNPGLWGWAPALQKLGNDMGFTPLVVGVCAVLYLVELLVGMAPVPPNAGILGMLFGFLSPTTEAAINLGASGAAPVSQLGWWWTIFTAGWLHGSLIHIVLNLYYLKMLAPALAELYGLGRMTIIWVLSSAFGFLFTSVVYFLGIPYFGAPLTLGASAGLCGFLGALLAYSVRTGNKRLRDQMIQAAVAVLIFGLILRFVDNGAHFGGFLGGYVIARWLDPLRPETQGHLLAGLALLLLNAGVFLFHLLVAFRPFAG